MSGSSFQTNLFDYLRVVFHRLRWIVLLVGVSVATAWVWVEVYAPKLYRSQMIVMVYSKDQNNPHLKQMISKAPLAMIINNIREKLKVEKRLRHMACNVRFAEKEKYSASLGPVDGSPQVRLEEYLKGFPKTYKVGAQSVTITLKDLARFIDTQGLARSLGVVGMDIGTLNEYVIWNMETDKRYMGALRNKFFPNMNDVPLTSVRKAAEEELLRRLSLVLDGERAFDRYESGELIKEIVSIRRLLETRLYFCVGQFNLGDSLSEWVGKLKGGLSVSGLSGNLITILYSTDFSSDKMVITDSVVRVAFAMIESEYRATEKSQWIDTKAALHNQKNSISQELDVINRDLYNLEQLTKLQLSFQEAVRGDDVSAKGTNKLTPYWSDPFMGLPKASTHIRRIDKLLTEAREINKEIQSAEALSADLEQVIKDPSKQRVTVRRIIEKSDTPEIINIKNRLAKCQLKRRKLMQTCTSKHPFMVKLDKEISELEAALRTFRMDLTETEIEEKTNPQLTQWKNDLDETNRKLIDLRTRARIVDEYIREEKKKAADAIVNQREYQAKLERQKVLQDKMAFIQRKEEDLDEKRRIGEDFQPVFEVHTDARPGYQFEPRKELVLLIALLAGGLAAAMAVFMLEYTDHSIKTTEDVKRFLGLPVLGTIPEFSFEDIEKTELSSFHLGSSRSRDHRHIYPHRLDEAEPVPVRMRAKVKSLKQSQIKWIFMVGVLLLCGLAAKYVSMSDIKGFYSRVTSKASSLIGGEKKPADTGIDKAEMQKREDETRSPEVE